MIIIRRLFLLLLIIISCSMIANADDDKSFKCEGKVYSSISSTGRVNSSSSPVDTGFEWTDNKGNKYPIYISSSGSCYIIKKSNKTGKEYKQYLKPDVSQDICKKLGREYKAKK